MDESAARGEDRRRLLTRLDASMNFRRHAFGPLSLLAVAALCLAALQAGAAVGDDDLHKMLQRIVVETKVVMRMGIDGTVADFKSDGDPDTLELVILDKPMPGMNTVSEDGEAIFEFEASDNQRTELFTVAFQRRAALRLAQAGKAASGASR